MKFDMYTWQKILTILGYLLVIPLFFACKGFIQAVQANSLIEKGLINIAERFNKLSRKREYDEQVVRQLYGDSKPKGLLNMIEKDLRYAGLLRGISLELLLTLYLGVLMILFVAIYTGTHSLFSALFVPILVVFIVKMMINVSIRRRYTAIDKSFSSLLDTILSYCLVTDNLTKILEGTGLTLRGIVGDELLWAVNKIKRGGGSSDVLKELEINSPHRLFKTLIRNLEIASRNQANYSSVVDSLREMYVVIEENEKQLAVKRHSVQLATGCIAVCGIVCVVLVATGILGIGTNDILAQLANSTIGLIDLIWLTIMLGITLVFIFGGKGGAD